MRIQSLILLLIFSIGASGFAEPSKTESFEKAALDKDVSAIEASPNFLAYLRKQGDSGLLGALKEAQSDYANAVQKLADQMAKCHSKSLDATWRKRAEDKLGADKLKKIKKDLKLAIGAKNTANRMACEKPEVESALYAEANLLPLLFDLEENLADFIKTANSSDAQLAQAAKKYIDTIRTVQPTPLQMILNPTLQLKTIAKAALVNKEVKEFVDSEPAFKSDFNLAAALKSLDNSSKP